MFRLVDIWMDFGPMNEQAELERGGEWKEMVIGMYVECLLLTIDGGMWCIRCVYWLVNRYS